MQHAARIAVVLVCLFAVGAGKQKAAGDPDLPSGAWLETHLKWNHPSSSINPQLEASQATILYFGEDHSFAKLMCVVVRVSGEPAAIKDDDGIVLWRGQWSADRKGIAVTHEFVVPRPEHWPEGPVMGPAIEHTIIRRSHDQLSFAEMKFERASELDDDAHHAMLTTSTPMKLPPDQ